MQSSVKLEMILASAIETLLEPFVPFEGLC